MPLSSPTERKHIHTRQVACQGFRRADGLWDIEGHITDIKTYPFANDYRGAIQPGDPIHDMWIRLTVDDGFEVKAVEAVTTRARSPCARPSRPTSSVSSDCGSSPAGPRR